MATYKLTQQSGQFSGSSHSDFPAYVDLSEIDAAMSQADADSIRVYSDASLTTELAREIVSTEEMHVKIPTFTSGDEIWVDVDGVRSDYNTTDTFGAEAVWPTGHRFHMDDASGGITDSTGTANGTENGNPTYGVTSQIGDGIDFDGAGDMFEVADNAASDLDGEFTISYWVNFDSVSSASQSPISKESGYSGSGTGFLLYKPSSGIVRLLLKDGTQDLYDTTTTLSADTWYKLTATRDASNNISVYINDTESATGTDSKDLTSTSPVNIGERGDGSHDVDGTLDEMYIVKGIGYSGDWITTEYNNQNSPSTFWSVEEVVSRRIFNIS